MERREDDKDIIKEDMRDKFNACIRNLLNMKDVLLEYEGMTHCYEEVKEKLNRYGFSTNEKHGSLDICYNVQSVVDAQNHFVIDISTTNNINDQNQFYVMAKDAVELLDVENPTVIADTGYYNGTEI